LLGIEINPRAAALAELVLWIGFLQWHIRTFGNTSVAEPVIHDYGNIECRDAVLAYDRVDFVMDASGKAVTRWDSAHFKPHPVTGELVPDEAFRTPLENYTNPRKAEWPKADFIVGNPPFIGNKRMRDALGDGYVEALRGAWHDVPDNADFVMYWWDHAAKMTRASQTRRFGLITTNSVRQAFNRRVVERAMSEVGTDTVSLAFAIADHPWVDAALGADVRIAMTVGVAGKSPGELLTLTNEESRPDGEAKVTFASRSGVVHADLTVGANASAALRLEANGGLCFQGMNLVGKGFRVDADEVRKLGYDVEALPDVIKPHYNARDLLQSGGHCFVIDLFGFSADQAMRQHPALYQWLMDRVKPERDHNKDAQRRRDWWLFGRSNRDLRAS
jgi:hypothetical protein